jgi:hypothetical protein
MKKQVLFNLEVTAAPDFFPTVSPSNLAVAKGVEAVYNISFTAQGPFVGQLNLGVLNAPLGAIVIFGKPSIGVGESTTMRIQTQNMSVGMYSLTLELVANS